jgi:hypothetical protein
LNEETMLNQPASSLALMDAPKITEGKAAWVQLADLATNKASVYVDGAANILVIVSDSECLELMTASAVHEYDGRAAALADRRLCRLNGIMLVNRGWIECGPDQSNVDSCQTECAAFPLSETLSEALKSIRVG